MIIKKNNLFFKSPPVIIFLLLIAWQACTQNRISRFEFQQHQEACRSILSASKPWMGTPYKYGGNSYKGVDCSGFVQQIYKEVFRIDLPRTTEDMYETGTPVRGNQRLECGDLVFFQNIRSRGIDHVGIYVGADRFIHASSSGGVVLSDLNSTYYQSHFVAARRSFN